MELRETAHDGEAIRGVVEFVVEAHLHVAIHHVRASLNVERDKIQRDWAAVRCTLLRRAVSEKKLQIL